jgi:hypothetical protein
MSRVSSAPTGREEGSGGGDERMPDGRGGCEAGITEGRASAEAAGAALGLDGGGGADFNGGGTGGLLAGRVGNSGGCLGGGNTAACPFCAFAMMCLPRWTAPRDAISVAVCNRGTERFRVHRSVR